MIPIEKRVKKFLGIVERVKKMDRKRELLKVFSDIDDIKEVITPLIEDVIFLEDKLMYLRTLPFIRVNPNNAADQKATPAAKQYKEFLQQYNNCIKILCSVITKNNGEEESPLRAFLKGRVNHD